MKNIKNNPFAFDKTTYGASFDWPSDEFGFSVPLKPFPTHAWQRNEDANRTCARKTAHASECADDPKGKAVDKQVSMEVRAMITRYPYLMADSPQSRLPPSTEMIQYAYHSRGPSFCQGERSEMGVSRKRGLKDVDCHPPSCSCPECGCSEGGRKCVDVACKRQGVADEDDAKGRTDAYRLPKRSRKNPRSSGAGLLKVVDDDDPSRFPKESRDKPRSSRAASVEEVEEDDAKDCPRYSRKSMDHPESRLAHAPEVDTFSRIGWSREGRQSTGKTKYQEDFSDLAVEMLQMRAYSTPNKFWMGNPERFK